MRDPVIEKVRISELKPYENNPRDNDAAVDKVASRIVSRAARDIGYKNQKQIRDKISGYAKMNNAEAVAEAFADVYCNGTRASRESRAIVNVLNSYF